MTALPPKIQDVLKRYRDGQITATQRDAELTSLAEADTRSAGLRNVLGVETRIFTKKPKLGA
jgi:hypothetical protein